MSFTSSNLPMLRNMKVIAEAIELMHLTKDPKATKKAIEALIKEQQVLEDMKAETAKNKEEAETALQAIEKGRAAEERYIKRKQEMIDALQAEKEDLLEKSKALGEQKRETASVLEELKVFERDKRAELKALESSAKSMQKTAEKTMDEAMTLKAEYKEKLGKLKSIAG